MENLEEQIIKRLNNHLEKYGFCIKSTDTDAHLFGSYYDVFSWGLFDKNYSNKFTMGYRIVYLWKTSNDMLLSKNIIYLNMLNIQNIMKYVILDVVLAIV